MAGFGNENVAAPNAPALPNRTSRRETAIKILPIHAFPASVIVAGARAARFVI
jgi:hypothetical protein